MSQILINDNSVHTNIIISDVYKLFLVENVVQYSLMDFKTFKIETCETKNKDIQYYFVIDLTYHDAFAHWVYESAIYLPIFYKIKEKYSNVKLLLKGHKEYKMLFVKFFNISENDVKYDSEIKTANVCLFPSPISALNDKSVLTDNYMNIVSNFVNIFLNSFYSNDFCYDYIILPRQTKENYNNNNRTYDMDSIFKSIENTTTNYFVLNTDNISDLSEQITKIRSSSKVILTDGSPFLVNNMFCRNQNIYIIGNITNVQSLLFPRIKYVIDIVCKLNKNAVVYFTPHADK